MTDRIVQIIPTLDQGGAEKQLTLLAANLPRDLFEVHVCTLTHGGPLEQPLRGHDIPIHSINKSWKLDPPAYWRLRNLLCRLKPQLVHTWIFAANSYGRQAAIAPACHMSWPGSGVSIDGRCGMSWPSTGV